MTRKAYETIIRDNFLSDHGVLVRQVQDLTIIDLNVLMFCNATITDLDGKPATDTEKPCTIAGNNPFGINEKAHEYKERVDLIIKALITLLNESSYALNPVAFAFQEVSEYFLKQFRKALDEHNYKVAPIIHGNNLMHACTTKKIKQRHGTQENIDDLLMSYCAIVRIQHDAEHELEAKLEGQYKKITKELLVGVFDEKEVDTLIERFTFAYAGKKSAHLLVSVHVKHQLALRMKKLIETGLLAELTKKIIECSKQFESSIEMVTFAGDFNANVTGSDIPTAYCEGCKEYVLDAIITYNEGGELVSTTPLQVCLSSQPETFFKNASTQKIYTASRRVTTISWEQAINSLKAIPGAYSFVNSFFNELPSVGDHFDQLISLISSTEDVSGQIGDLGISMQHNPLSPNEAIIKVCARNPKPQTAIMAGTVISLAELVDGDKCSLPRLFLRNRRKDSDIGYLVKDASLSRPYFHLVLKKFKKPAGMIRVLTAYPITKEMSIYYRKVLESEGKKYTAWSALKKKESILSADLIQAYATTGVMCAPLSASEVPAPNDTWIEISMIMHIVLCIVGESYKHLVISSSGTCRVHPDIFDAEVSKLKYEYSQLTCKSDLDSVFSAFKKLSVSARSLVIQAIDSVKESAIDEVLKGFLQSYVGHEWSNPYASQLFSYITSVEESTMNISTTNSMTLFLQNNRVGKSSKKRSRKRKNKDKKDEVGIKKMRMADPNTEELRPNFNEP